MKQLFKLNLDGIYTSIERVEVDSQESYKRRLTDWPDTYFKTFAAAKKAALSDMQYQLDGWKCAVMDMKAQNKENY